MLTACHLASSRWGGGPAVAASPHSGPTPRALFSSSFLSFARAQRVSLAARFFCQDFLLYIMKACQHLSLNASTPDDRCVGRHGTPTRAHIHSRSLETAQMGIRTSSRQVRSRTSRHRPSSSGESCRAPKVHSWRARHKNGAHTQGDAPGSCALRNHARVTRPLYLAGLGPTSDAM